MVPPFLHTDLPSCLSLIFLLPNPRSFQNFLGFVVLSCLNIVNEFLVGLFGGMFWCHFWQLLVCPEVAIFGNLMNVVTKLPKMATPGQATFGMSRCYHFWQLGGRIPPSCQKWQLLHIPKVANFCYVNAVAIFGNLMGVFQQVARNGNILT